MLPSWLASFSPSRLNDKERSGISTLAGRLETAFVCHPTKPSPTCQTPQWRRLRDDAHPKQQQFPIYPSIHPPTAFLQMTLIPQICWPYRESDDKECRWSRQLLLNRRQFVCVIAKSASDPQQSSRQLPVDGYSDISKRYSPGQPPPYPVD